MQGRDALVSCLCVVACLVNPMSTLAGGHNTKLVSSRAVMCPVMFYTRFLSELPLVHSLGSK